MTNAKETFLKYLMIKPALALQIQNCFFLNFNQITSQLHCSLYHYDFYQSQAQYILAYEY